MDRHTAGRWGAAIVADALVRAGENEEDEEQYDHGEKIETHAALHKPDTILRLDFEGGTLLWKIPATTYLRGTASKPHRSCVWSP